METPSPHISGKLLEWLAEKFKDRLPQEELPAFELGRRVGQQDVIRKLTHEHNRPKNR